MEKQLAKISKYLSFILRHKPEAIGLTLDENGWAFVDELILKTTDLQLTEELIKLVVETSDKQRFAIDSKKNRIRANQGHSIDIDLSLDPIKPPETLLHGTAERFYESIMHDGLTKQSRHHVHLSESPTVAKSVGSRYGKPVILEIDANRMSNDGFLFYQTLNNVWLVDTVPVKYIRARPL